MLQVNEHSYSMSQELKKLSISVLLEINEQRGRTPTFVCSGVRVFAWEEADVLGLQKGQSPNPWLVWLDTYTAFSHS